MTPGQSRVFVCANCIEDVALQEVIQDNASSMRCDFCEAESVHEIACHLDHIIDRMRFAIEQEYNDPASELPYESAEGGYQGTVLTASELFDKIGFSVENEKLFDELLEAFNDGLYCIRDYFGPTTGDFFSAAWRRFKAVIQHHRRYTFWSSLRDEEFSETACSLPAGRMLAEIASKLEQVSPVELLPAGAELWRVRVHERSAPLIDPREFTPPPQDLANQPNRMSPAGIPMFYGAEDFETAYVETVEADRMVGKVATGARFRTLFTLKILDLTAPNMEYSFFSEVGRQQRHAIEFLQVFADELSRPIERDGRQHIEYVPTQAFTEYVRYELLTPDGEPFHGIKFKSSRNSRSCYVIFAEQEDCLPGAPTSRRPQMLEFIAGALRTDDRLGT